MKARVATIVLAALAVAPAAFAHTHLKSSMPADKAVLDKAPTELMLHFSEATKITAVTLQKQGEGEAHKLAALPKEPTANATIPLQSLTQGEYTVEWRAVGDDNHVMKGTLHFTIKPTPNRR